MVFFRGLVIALCGFNLILEVAKMFFIMINRYGRAPFFVRFMPVNAFINRTTFFPGFGPVFCVLGSCDYAEIGPAVIQSIAIDMVNKQLNHEGGAFSFQFIGQYLPMHVYGNMAGYTA